MLLSHDCEFHLRASVHLKVTIGLRRLTNGYSRQAARFATRPKARCVVQETASASDERLILDPLDRFADVNGAIHTGDPGATKEIPTPDRAGGCDEIRQGR